MQPVQKAGVNKIRRKAIRRCRTLPTPNVADVRNPRKQPLARMESVAHADGSYVAPSLV